MVFIQANGVVALGVRHGYAGNIAQVVDLSQLPVLAQRAYDQAKDLMTTVKALHQLEESLSALANIPPPTIQALLTCLLD